MAKDGGSDGRTKLIVAGVIVLVLLVFIGQNTETANVNFLFFDHETALWLVIAISAVLGFVAGWFVGRSSLRR
jgi:uncharacterized integral membrane protein